MGSQIPTLLMTPRMIVLLSGGQVSDRQIREAANRGELPFQRDSTGDRLYKHRDVIDWLGSFDKRKSEIAAKDAARIHKETRRRQSREAKERRRGKE